MLLDVLLSQRGVEFRPVPKCTVCENFGHHGGVPKGQNRIQARFDQLDLQGGDIVAIHLQQVEEFPSGMRPRPISLRLTYPFTLLATELLVTYYCNPRTRPGHSLPGNPCDADHRLGSSSLKQSDSNTQTAFTCDGWGHYFLKRLKKGGQ